MKKLFLYFLHSQFFPIFILFYFFKLLLFEKNTPRSDFTLINFPCIVLQNLQNFCRMITFKKQYTSASITLTCAWPISSCCCNCCVCCCFLPSGILSHQICSQIGNSCLPVPVDGRKLATMGAAQIRVAFRKHCESVWKNKEVQKMEMNWVKLWKLKGEKDENNTKTVCHKISFDLLCNIKKVDIELPVQSLEVPYSVLIKAPQRLKCI